LGIVQPPKEAWAYLFHLKRKPVQGPRRSGSAWTTPSACSS